MITRRTVRALLFNPDGDMLMFKYKNDPKVYNPKRPPVTQDYWGLCGGGMEADETCEEAILREIREETGHVNITLGPVIWHRTVNLVVHDNHWHVDEKYFVAHTRDTAISADLHTPLERKTLIDWRWWRVADVQSTLEMVFPQQLKAHIADLAAGRYPATVLRIVDE